MAAVEFTLDADASLDDFMAELTAAVDNNDLNVSTTAFTAVAIEATLRGADTTAATDSTMVAAAASTTESGDIDLSADGSTDADSGTFFGTTLSFVVGGAVVVILLVVVVCTVSRSRRKAQRDQGGQVGMRPDNNGWGGNNISLSESSFGMDTGLSMAWRTEVRDGTPNHLAQKPPSTNNPVFRGGHENATHMQQDTDWAIPKVHAAPVAAPRPTSEVQYLTQSDQAFASEPVLYSAATEGYPSEDASQSYPRPVVQGSGVVQQTRSSGLSGGSRLNKRSPSRPVPVLRLEPAKVGLTEDEMSIRMASITRDNPLNLQAEFAAMDGTVVTNPSFDNSFDESGI